MISDCHRSMRETGCSPKDSCRQMFWRGLPREGKYDQRSAHLVRGRGLINADGQNTQSLSMKDTPRNHHLKRWQAPLASEHHLSGQHQDSKPHKMGRIIIYPFEPAKCPCLQIWILFESLTYMKKTCRGKWRQSQRTHYSFKQGKVQTKHLSQCFSFIEI